MDDARRSWSPALRSLFSRARFVQIFVLMALVGAVYLASHLASLELSAQLGGGRRESAPLRTRAEVHALVLGKTKEQVFEILGSPTRTEQRYTPEGEARDLMVYRMIVKERLREQPDRWTVIELEPSGEVVDVTFFDR